MAHHFGEWFGGLFWVVAGVGCLLLVHLNRWLWLNLLVRSITLAAQSGCMQYHPRVQICL